MLICIFSPSELCQVNPDNPNRPSNISSTTQKLPMKSDEERRSLSEDASKGEILKLSVTNITSKAHAIQNGLTVLLVYHNRASP